MKHEEGSSAIRRILVALDASPASLTALETAVELAQTLQAELVGLFVEDINLVRIAALSFSQEVGLFSATRRQLSTLSIERQLRSQANRARQALAALAERAGVNWSFQTARGVVSSELLAAALDADLIILGRTGGAPLGRRRQIGSTARSILIQTPNLTLLLQPGTHPQLPLLLLYDGSAVAQKALQATAQLMRNRTNGHISVLLLAADPGQVQSLQQEVAAELAKWGVEARYTWHSEISAQQLAQAVQMGGCRMLVIPSDGSALDQDAIFALLNRIDCPVLLVR